MRFGHRLLNVALLAGVVVASPMVLTSCMHHSSGYVWSDAESPHYVAWEHETHRDHVEYASRNADEQKEYWGWRHDHP